MGSSLCFPSLSLGLMNRPLATVGPLCEEEKKTRREKRDIIKKEEEKEKLGR